MKPQTSILLLVRSLCNGMVGYQEFIDDLLTRPFDTEHWEQSRLKEFKVLQHKYCQNTEADKLSGFTERELKQFCTLLILAASEAFFDVDKLNVEHETEVQLI